MNAPDRVPEDTIAIDVACPVTDLALSYQSSPIHLRAVAQLYGLTTVPLETARVLYLACGSGTNLFPFAAAYPEAKIVGIDPDPTKIETACQSRDAWGIANIKFVNSDFSEITQDFGEFDYVIVADSFSFLDRDAAAEVLRICRLNLAYEGVAYVEYDTYPGAKSAEIVRDAVLLHTLSITNEVDKIAAARAALELFGDGVSTVNPMAPALRVAARQVARDLDRRGIYALRSLQRQPYYYAEFADFAGQYGMVCAGDANPQSELATTFGTSVALSHSMLALGKPAELRQQYLDFATGRERRHALLTHHERQSELNLKPNLDVLTSLRWAGMFERVPCGAADPEKSYYLNHHGNMVVADSEVMERILDALGCVWPASLSYKNLVKLGKASGSKLRGMTPADSVKKVIETLFLLGAARFCLDSSPYDDLAPNQWGAVIGARVPSYLSGFQTQFNLWHEAVDCPLNEVDLEYLEQVDRKISIEQISLVAMEGKRDVEDGIPGSRLACVLGRLKHAGLLRSRARDWRDYLQDGLVASRGIAPFWALYIDSLMRVDSESDSSIPSWRASSSTNDAVLKEGRELVRMINTNAAVDLEARAKKLTKRAPNHPSAWDLLAMAARRRGKAQESLEYLLKGIVLDPHSPDRYTSLVGSFRFLGRRWDEVESCDRYVRRLESDYVPMLNLMGVLLQKAARFHEAEVRFRRALKLDPESNDARVNLGSCLGDLGHFEAAEVVYRDVLERDPNHSAARSNRFFTMNYFPGRSAEEIHAAYLEYGATLASSVRRLERRFLNNRDPERRLRVGYVSPDLRRHPVSLFLLPLLANHDRAAVEVFAYAELDRADDATEELRVYIDHWQLTNGMSDEILANRIREDGIDILIDLAGHTGRNRLQVFARRAAPVQLTWLGFGTTTGVPEMDYILTDSSMAPIGREHLLTEVPWRLSKTNFVYRPMLPMGDVNTLPALRNGYIRYVSLSRAIRLNDQLIRVWSELLRRVPGSRLVLDSSSYVDLRIRADIIARFAHQGVDAARIEMGYHSPPWDLLRSADIALDCFPHNSGTTIFESLYMGLPAITLAGNPGVGRIGMSILTGLGRPDWVAQTESQYIEKIVALATDIPELARIRAGLRQEMQASALMDEPGFARKVEQAYRDMFKKWCEGSV
ncbi:bifunctional class I SAM-dependent methyltransferase/glycosyltransferase [Achromobacter pestifer]|uniref:protein O-GlcNAc transferase n=1 Tax=Achromobacter pestifer TaxID=1353889 RepID=A0A6S6YRT9_9BURK|nr:bifunctional class I SAM-dependent methyltransferase/glycosyltransferase [Achromobacter pestifer]CAB3630919.1 hypothetical protein LMG3431_01174 [Achromobacter pestifer]